MIKTIILIIGILILVHLICGLICIFFYLDKSLRINFSIIDLLLMLIFGPLIVIVFGFLYLKYYLDNLFNKLRRKLNERKSKI